MTALAIAAAAVALHWPRIDDHRWVGDEPHKISETHFLRLMLDGDLSNPVWYEDRFAQSNPPAGKVIFGAGILLAGEDLPRDLAIQRELLASTGFTTSEATRLANLDRLIAVRRISVVATAVSAASIFLIVSAPAGVIAGSIAAVLFLRHYAIAMFATRAVHDPILTAAMLLVLLSVPGIVGDATRGRRFLTLFAAALAAAVAFQTRLSGLSALGAAAVVIVMAGMLRGTTRRGFLSASVLVVLALLIGIGMNPYYWYPAGESAERVLPVRVAMRFERQVVVLGELMHGHSYEIRSWPERARFEARVLTSGHSGKAVSAGTLFLLLLLLIRPTWVSPPARIAGAGAAVLAAVILVWLPMRWERYLQPVIASFAVCTGLGCGAVMGRIGKRLGGRRTAGVAGVPGSGGEVERDSLSAGNHGM